MMTRQTLFSIILLFFGVFALYIVTLHPAVSPYRDSGDLIVASKTLGIAHPPGYPVYVLAGKITSQLLPFANAAYRINAVSALFGAAGILVLALSVNILFKNDPAALWPLLFLAFSPAYWRLSQVSEMYSLNALFTAVIIFLAARHPVSVYLTALIAGFASGNHQTIIFIFPGLLWYFYAAKTFSVKDLVDAALFFALGLSVYLFLPIRSSAGPLFEWGKPDSISSFLRIVTRADYGGLRLHPEQSQFHWTIPAVAGHLLVYSKSLIGQFTVFGALLGVAGIIVTFKDRFYKFLLAALLLSGPGFVILSNLPPSKNTTLPILEPHLVMPAVVFAVFIAAGAVRLSSLHWARFIMAAALVLAFVTHSKYCDYRGHFYAYDYGRNLLSTAGRGAFIYNPDDPTAFITTYLTAVENKRTDVKLIAYFRTRWGYELLKKRYPEIMPAREIASGYELERVLLDHNRLRYPIYAELPGKFPQGYSSYPSGILYRLSEQDELAPSEAPFEFYALRNKYVDRPANDFFTNQIISYYASARNNIGLGFAREGKHDLARRQYLKALAINPRLSAAYNNLGILAYFTGGYAEAESWYSTLIKNEPDDAAAQYNLGLVYKAQKRNDDAAALFARIWETYRYPDAGNELGLAALASGDNARAQELYRSLLEYNPNFTLAYYNMALALERTGRREEARKYFERYRDAVTDPVEKQETQTILDKRF